jgi:tetratricopeptide (TPR) repeat protein
MRIAITRWILAASCVAFSVWLMLGAMNIQSIGAMGHVLFSLCSLVTAVLLIAPDTIFRIAEWCSRPFVEIFFPSEKFSKPPLSYLLARRYMKEKRFEQAIDQYRSIIHYYPKEKDAYLELLEAAHELGDEQTWKTYAALYKKKHFPEESKQPGEPRHH